jgi:ABC-type microcin C transport system permease subunit YejE
MLALSSNKISANNLAARAAFVLFLLLFAFAGSSNAQAVAKQTKAFQPQASAVQVPLWQDYKGVKIGMTAAEAQAKLGAPTVQDKDGLFYNFSETESVQVILDAQQKVRVISVMFAAGHPNPPSFENVFGKDEKVEPNAAGGIYKLIRYPGAGYWVSYSRLAGDKPLVTVTIQKL